MADLLALLPFLRILGLLVLGKPGAFEQKTDPARAPGLEGGQGLLSFPTLPPTAPALALSPLCPAYTAAATEHFHRCSSSVSSL